MKRPNPYLIGVPECDGESESKLENTFQNIIQENFPNLERQANIQVQEIWDYVKRPNLHLLGVPECDRENESKLENAL